MKKPNRRYKKPPVVDSPSPQSANRDTKPPSPPPQHQQQQDNRLDDLQRENDSLKRENEELKNKLANITPNSIETHQKHNENNYNDDDARKFLALEVMQLKKKLNELSQLSAQKHSSSSQKKRNGNEAALNEIQRLKAQRVQLFCKMKLDSVHHRLSRASLEKQVLQLKKDQRRKDYEIHKLLVLNEKQRLVLQRKTEEASQATKRFKDFLESRMAASQCNSDFKSGQSPGTQGIDLELKIAARVEDMRADYERQMEEMAEEVRKYEEEAETLREENFRYLLQQKEVDCMATESELKDLKEELLRLSNVVNQLGMPKVDVYRKKVHLVKASVSFGSSLNFTDTPESEESAANNVVRGESMKKACCSCGKKSLCKTSRCECVAAFGSCGTGCGCVVSKCTNRRASSKINDLRQQEVAQDATHFSGTVLSKPADPANDNVPIRKPLSEIGNTVKSERVEVNPSPKRPGKKGRGRKPVAQLDTAAAIPEATEGIKKDEITDLVAVDKPRLTRAKRTAL